VSSARLKAVPCYKPNHETGCIYTAIFGAPARAVFALARVKVGEARTGGETGRLGVEQPGPPTSADFALVGVEAFATTSPGSKAWSKSSPSGPDGGGSAWDKYCE